MVLLAAMNLGWLLRRRPRGRSSTPTQFATPPPPSCLASSNSTPPASRPSASDPTEEIDKARRLRLLKLVRATAPTFVWGTNISVQDVKSAIEMFVKHFREAKENSDELFREGKYMGKVLEIEGEWIDVDAYDVFDYDPDFYNKMVRFGSHWKFSPSLILF